MKKLSKFLRKNLIKPCTNDTLVHGFIEFISEGREWIIVLTSFFVLLDVYVIYKVGPLQNTLIITIFYMTILLCIPYALILALTFTDDGNYKLKNYFEILLKEINENITEKTL